MSLCPVRAISNALDGLSLRFLVFQVPGSSFALELLRNPQQYSYDSWAYGFAWPVGADGRRLLLRKLRGVYWSNPEKWQRILQENNLYRRDLFTLATVQVGPTPVGVENPNAFWHLRIHTNADALKKTAVRL